MTYYYPDSRILIFAKAAIPGAVKTRLIGKLNAQQAAEVHKMMLIHTVNMVLESELAPVSLYCYPDTSHEVFEGFKKSGVIIKTQSGNNLGSRMANAIEETLNYESNVVLIGADCPVMSGQYLAYAFEKLLSYETVIGPAEDGGYVLVGQNRLNITMFENINWSTSGVLSQTRQRLRDHNVDWWELDTLWDVDRPGDLQRLEMLVMEKQQAFG